MKRFLLIISLLVFVLVLNVENEVSANPMNIEYIDVKLSKPITIPNLIKLESLSGFMLYNKLDKSKELKQILETIIIATPDGIGGINLLDSQNKIIEKIPGDGTILIGLQPGKEQNIKVEKDRYRDYILFKSNGNDINIINHVKLENYLYGVVPREMPASWPIEALKAQAIAARNYALKNINKHSKLGYNLCDTVDCQVYYGLDGENINTNKAVDETKDIYAYYKGELISALYHSSSGGYTEDSGKVWKHSYPYLKPVEDKYSNKSPYNNWKIDISKGELSSKLSSANINVGEINGFEVTKTTSSGRVESISVKGSLGEEVITGAKLRSILGGTILKSTLFNIKNEGTSTNSNIVYVLDGNGKKTLVNLNGVVILDASGGQTTSRNNSSSIINRDGTKNIDGVYTETIVKKMDKRR